MYRIFNSTDNIIKTIVNNYLASCTYKLNIFAKSFSWPVNCMGVAYNNFTRIDHLKSEVLSLSVALNVIDSALRKFCLREDHSRMNIDVYDLNCLLIAFNGGKDCTLLLFLVLSRISCLQNTTGSIRLMYIKDSSEETFAEVAEFVEKTKKELRLESIEVESGSMKNALTKIVDEHPEVRGIFLGTRATDPNAGWMDYFCHTSPGWPNMELIAPILHMNYADVWRVIRGLGIEYCSLYRRGYTSIGSRSSTRPNPVLSVGDGSNEYLHADQLEDDSKERLGRVRTV